jgi:hypothetical protein
VAVHFSVVSSSGDGGYCGLAGWMVGFGAGFLFFGHSREARAKIMEDCVD